MKQFVESLKGPGDFDFSMNLEQIYEVYKNKDLIGFYKNTFDSHKPYYYSDIKGAEKLLLIYNTLKNLEIYHPDTAFSLIEKKTGYNQKRFGVQAFSPLLDIYERLSFMDYSLVLQVTEKRNELERIVNSFGFESHFDVDLDWNWGVSKNKIYYHDMHIIQ